MGITASHEQTQQLVAFLEILSQWNQRFNLTAVRSPLEMVRRHLLDSVSILPYLKGERLLDCGTGAGLPGIPLSILSPQRTFYLLDSNQKKQIFVSQAIKMLGLKNAEAVHSSVEAYQPEQKFSTILTRAFAPLPRMIALTQHLLEQDGCFLAMMGKVSDEDQLLVPDGYAVLQMVTLTVPGESAARHVAIVRMINQK